MATVIVERPSRYTDYLRSYEVEIDGRAVASVDDGESVEVDVEAGRHKARATIDWCMSPTTEIDVTEADQTVLRVGIGRPTVVHLLFSFLFITVWRKQYLEVEQVK